MRVQIYQIYDYGLLISLQGSVFRIRLSMRIREWVLDIVEIFMTLALCVPCTGTRSVNPKP
jgi:hypothetical protein